MQLLKMSKTNIQTCKDNLKNKLKDRKRTKGFCFSYSKDKFNFNSLNNKKNKNIFDKISFNEKVKNLVKNFKNIKNDINILDKKEKEEKKIENYEKLFKDKGNLEYNKMHLILNKFTRNKKFNQEYILQKSKIYTESNDINYSQKKILNMSKNISLNFYNAINKIDFEKKIKENNNYDNIRKFNKFFKVLKFYKKYKSDKIINNNSSNKNYNYTYRDINTNININKINYILNTSKNNTINNDGKHCFRSYSTKNPICKNKLLKHIIIDSTQNNKETINKYKYIQSTKSLNKKESKKNLFSLKKSSIKDYKCNIKFNNKINLLLNSYININSNKINNRVYNNQKQITYNQTENSSETKLLTEDKKDNDLALHKRISFNNTIFSSRLSKVNKTSNFNTISVFNNNCKIKRKCIRNNTVKNMPLYAAKIGDFIKNFYRIKKENKLEKIKRRQSHLYTYNEIDKSINIKEDMMMFLLKDKYLKTKFPKKIFKKANFTKKSVLNKLIEKFDILENPFGKVIKCDFIDD